MSNEQDAINSRLSAMIAATPPSGPSHEDRYPAIWSAISELGPINGFDSLCEAVNEAIDLAVAEARNSALEEAAKAINAHIKQGELPEPAHSERNGMILAFNILHGMINPPAAPSQPL